MSAKSKSMIVTGAAQGIGAGVTRALLERGYNVVAEAPIGVMPSAHGGSENCQVVRHQRDITFQSFLGSIENESSETEARKNPHCQDAGRAACRWNSPRPYRSRHSIRVSPISSSIRLATSSVTKGSLRCQRVDFSQRILMAALLPDASRSRKRTEKAAFLKHDRSVPPLVRGWQKACTSRAVMASPLIPKAPDVDTQAFAVLTPAQIGCIRPLGRIRRAQSGETLYKPNDSTHTGWRAAGGYPQPGLLRGR